jgi:hypothetical protein
MNLDDDYDIKWSKSKYHLCLEMRVDWVKCVDIDLPPKKLGRCTDWRTVLSKDCKTAVFTARWDLKRVNFDELTNVHDWLVQYVIKKK